MIDDESDSTLLHEFTHGSDHAFAQLVHRHAHWVLAVARRRVRDPHLAEDVAQAAFIVLARKAHTLGPRTRAALPAWLFHVTRLAASRALRDEARRRRRETEAAMRFPRAIDTLDESPDATWREVEPHLDDSVARLRAADREAVLLRFYQHKTFGEVAAAIGATEEAARKRVSRAVDRLRTLLVRRGATVPAAAALSGAMWDHATQAATPAVVTSIAAGAACTTNLITQAGASLALAKGALFMMTVHKAKTAAAAAVILIFTGMLGIALVTQATAQLQGEKSKPHDKPVQAAAASPATAPADAHAEAAAKMKVTQVVPILQVGDLQTSLDYYTNQLGFQTEWTHGSPASFASITKDGLMIFLQEGGQHGGQHGGPQVVYMVANDVDAMHADLVARGAEIAQPPEDRPWGMREMIVKDPDANHIRVGTMRGHAEEPVKPKDK